MKRPLPKRPSEIDPGARADDSDPWNEFLPESTEELRPAGSTASTPAGEPLSPPVRPPRAFTPRTLQLLTVDDSETNDFIPEVREVHPTSLVTAAPVPPSQEFTSEGAEPVELSLVSPVVPEEAAPEPFALAQAPVPDAEYETLAPPRLERPMADAAPRRDQPSSHTETSYANDDGLSLSIATVVARQTVVRPAEAVATVRALCAAIGSSDDGSTLIPDMEDVLITADGRVTVRPGAGGEPDVRALGRMLHALLQGTKPPLPLRLFVTASLSAHRYQSVEFFAEALSHYGGPDGEELIAALYKRASDPRSKPAPKPMASLERAILRQPIVVAAARHSKTKAVMVAIAAVVLSATAAGLWLWWTARPTSANTPGSDARSTALQTPVRDDWQLGLIEVPEFSPEPVAPTPAPPAPATRKPPAARSVPPPPSGLNLPALIPEPLPPPPAVPTVREPVRSVVDRRPPISEPVSAPPTFTDPKVYGRGDADVQPPVPQSPRTLSMAFLDGPDGRPNNTLELLIDERGEVQSVRLQNRPQTMAEVNTLSSAKMWKFRAAVRDGVPVKYQLQVPLGTQAPR